MTACKFMRLVFIGLAFRVTQACAQELELEELRVAVAENEQLFSSLAATYHCQRNASEDSIFEAADPTRIDAVRTGIVAGLWSNEKYFAEDICFVTKGDGTIGRRIKVQAFDGSETRINHLGQVGNIVKEKVREYSLKPIYVGIPTLGKSASLAELLSFDAAKKQPYLSILRDWKRVEYRYDGNERKADLDCHKIDLFVFLDDGDAAIRHSLWICPSRNFLVAASESVDVRRNEQMPYEVTEISAWSEIESGIWIPSQANHKQYSFDGSGNPSLSFEETFDLAFCGRECDSNDERFSKVEFQQGLVVYVVQDGKIIDTLIDGHSVQDDRN